MQRTASDANTPKAERIREQRAEDRFVPELGPADRFSIVPFQMYGRKEIRHLVKLWPFLRSGIGASEVLRSDNVPHLLGGMAELAACDTGTQAVVTDGNRVVLEGVGKVIVSLGHGTHEDTDALLGAQRFDVVASAHHGGFETEGHLAAVGGEVVGDGVLDDLQELLLGVGGTDGEAVQQLHHQTSETLEGTRNAHARVHFDQDTLGSVDEDLQLTRLVHGGVEQGEQALTSVHH